MLGYLNAHHGFVGIYLFLLFAFHLLFLFRLGMKTGRLVTNNIKGFFAFAIEHHCERVCACLCMDVEYSTKSFKMQVSSFSKGEGFIICYDSVTNLTVTSSMLPLFIW